MRGGYCDIGIHRTLSLLDFKVVNLLLMAFSVSFRIWNSEDQNSTHYSLLQVELAGTCRVDAWIRAVNLLHSMVFTDIPFRDSFSDRLFSKKGRKKKKE